MNKFNNEHLIYVILAVAITFQLMTGIHYQAIDIIFYIVVGYNVLVSTIATFGLIAANRKSLENNKYASSLEQTAIEGVIHNTQLIEEANVSLFAFILTCISLVCIFIPIWYGIVSFGAIILHVAYEAKCLVYKKFGKRLAEMNYSE